MGRIGLLLQRRKQQKLYSITINILTMKTKIKIESVFGKLLFELEKEDNNIRKTLEAAVEDCANLYGANLRGANLYGANLRGAKGIPYITMNCPSDGTFTAWKKVDNKLIKLLIPEDAKRSSAMTMKCRCDKAKVLAITSLDEEKSFDEVVNVGYIPHITYKVGEIVYPDKFDEDRWNECSNGIHFFINKQDAINY